MKYIACAYIASYVFDYIMWHFFVYSRK